MTTPSGTISFQDLKDEFGNPGGGTDNLGDFRVSQNVHGDNFALDEGVPQSGSISFDNLRNKSLNVVVNVTGGTTLNAKSIYNSNNVVVIGGGTDKKQAGSRIIIHVRGTIQSVRGNGGNATTPALDTGSWGQARTVDIRVGPGGNFGAIRGGGGNGGKGGRPTKEKGNDAAARGEDGKQGTSALKLEHTIRNLSLGTNGYVIAGQGGGGGGGGAAGELEESVERVGGGGGGGGQGVPGGFGGLAGSNSGDGSSGFENVEQQPQNGEGGSASEGGEGGKGGANHEGNNEENESASSGGGGGGGGTIPGNGGERGQQNERGEEGNGEKGPPAVDFNTTIVTGSAHGGEGGEGGRGDARGTGQQDGPGANGGSSGYSIILNGNSQPTITNNDRSRIVGPFI